MFEPPDNNRSFPEIEEEVLRFWEENDTFAKSLANRKDCPQFVFYDGPPFATGLPHYGHLLAGTIKDVVPRYQTMRGNYVERTFGWDCHGLPVENEVEKELDLSSRHEIEAYGVSGFNEKCRSIVLRYTREWRDIVNRIGRWVDFDNGYRTMDPPYMESIWWVFRQLWDSGLIYEGFKVLPYCMRCATPLSNFEANQAYETVKDPSITVTFQSADDPDVYYLAWTTTPWTLPSNLALAVHPEIDYVKVEDGGVHYVLADALLPTYYGKNLPPIVSRFKGAELAGAAYKPLLPYFEHLREEGGFRILLADFVGTDAGTGIVHIAPGFGEDDFQLGRQHEMPVVCPVDDECRFTEEVPDYQGRQVKEADQDIVKQLKNEGKLVHKTTYEHSYPHCWRCEMPLIYRTVSTWFVQVTAVKESMLRANQGIHWVPEHIKDGRFGKWLENAHDWAISRNRYWGCPLPLWRSDDGEETVCVGSIEELEKKTGQKVTDLHKHYVDDLEIPSSQGKGTLKRVPEVLDCWFESGSMPYAEHHYPFENKEAVEKHLPADFIAEGLDQTRGWFYTLVVIAAALFDKPPFRNVVVNGLVLAADGRKMSKRLKNYPDPVYIMNTYGADSLRLCLLSSPVVRGEDLCFSEETVKQNIRSVIMPLWNAYTFFATYANVDGWTPSAGEAGAPAEPENALDRWMLSRLQACVSAVRDSMDNYDLQGAAVRFTSLVDDLTNWYIRRSRRRFWKSANDRDKTEAYATLHSVLLTFVQAAAPFIPFITESIFRDLRTSDMPESVHLCDFPEPENSRFDPDLDERMQTAITAVSLGRYLRTQNQLRVRQPLRKAVLVSAEPDVRQQLDAMAAVIREELNVKETEIHEDEETLVDLHPKANFKELGPRLGKKMPQAAEAIGKLDQDAIRSLRNGEMVQVALNDGDEIRIGASDVIIERHEKEEFPVANEGSITVALDTALDEEILQEGWAREIINRIQNLRKEAGLYVSDRIEVLYSVPQDIAPAIERFGEHIANETLAVRLQVSELGEEHELSVNGRECRFAINKVDTAVSDS